MDNIPLLYAPTLADPLSQKILLASRLMITGPMDDKAIQTHDEYRPMTPPEPPSLEDDEGNDHL